MAIIEVPSDTSAAAAAKQIRRQARHSIQTLQANLTGLVALVNVHGKAALATEFGSDAAEFATFYDDARALLLTFKPELSATIPARADLP